jgi:pimeloyl-ACP methyl ester carboxylesterase
MLNKKFTTLLFLFIVLVSFGQTPVGHTTITFNDATRTGGFGSGGGAGRQIQTEIYYPAASAGENVAVVGTNLPVISFGHGFVMSWDVYTPVWESLVNEGYIVAFPRTEGGFSPSHTEFGQDLAIIITKIQDLNLNASSLFFGKVGTTSAIMGHSMGGGSSFLAANYNSSITTMVTFAAANTDPSSVTAAQQITIPNLVIAGQNDCVAPPVDHQNDMYDSLISTYKTEITILGGGHCYFANSNFNCSFGEGTCSPNPTISRGEQQDATMDLANLWLRKFLKNNCPAADDFQDSLALSPRITYRQNNPITCASVGIKSNTSLNNIVLYPNPAKTTVYVGNISETTSYSIIDVLGKHLINKVSITNNESIDVSNLNQGIYFIELSSKSGQRMIKFIKE